MSNQKQDPILIDVPMPIETPRLILRPQMTGDGAQTNAAIRETWEDLNRWMDWAEQLPAPEESEMRARKAHAQFILREDLALTGIEKASGRPVIWTGLHRFDWDRRRFEIGYWVRKKAQGKGYATESTNALVRYAFNALAASRVEITHSAGNNASAAVIRKLGFVPEGVRRSATRLPDGTLADSHIYARLDDAGLPTLAVRWGPP